ncbi:DEAD/DEAH box helicase [Helicobacter macacae]|uniref:ATP-dependent DNA helicase RecG n=1 Tax=Helicobacter macacae MIT 99-5501 TaxID=1357400 RepID=V8C9F3_9HELI|nr:DEAD/DEAH box helicase [Helicobacter macacae]ETD23969.1 ATP-dependent DNA helicase RecG [Helicobacter macacae MIT 99-5501]
MQSLAQFGFGNLYELILTPPHSYQNTMPIRNLIDGTEGALSLQITDSRYRPKAYTFYGFSKSLNAMVELVYFYPKPYHKALFTLGQEVIVQGKMRLNNGTPSFIQPKVIKSLGEILPIFKVAKHKSTSIHSLCKTYITQKNLSNLGLPSDIAQSIMEIFYPNDEFYALYTSHKGFSGKHLEALKFVELFYYALRLSKKKSDFPAKYVCSGDYSGFVSSLPFRLTNAQSRVIAEIASDFGSGRAARRLVMGDVGCGKTMVILSSVMIAYPQKSLLMAPTTILAKQLYEQAKLYLPSFVRVGLITGDSKEFKTSKDSTQKSKGKKDSKDFDTLFEYDFIIGTQALLYRDIEGEDFALVMSDEQHRFGTKQRYALEKLASSTRQNSSTDSKAKSQADLDLRACQKENPKTKQASKPHILQFSATPIPRTMAMLESKMIDVSIIDELPFKKDISTRIITRSDFKELLAHIQSEVAQNHQVAIIYPLVEQSEVIDYLSLSEGARFWQERFSGVFITSGQDKDKQEVLEAFAKEGKILLATTLIEVGISLPNLSTIVIIAPERLGLATLHQLRGRVSRNGLKGYCFLYTQSSGDNARLKDFATQSSGFEIARLDLAYRKSGDLLSGDKQSGENLLWADLAQDEDILKRALKELES